MKGARIDGSTLLELLVSMMLLGFLLLIALSIEASILHAMRGSESLHFGGRTSLAMESIRKDIREAVVAEALIQEDANEQGSSLLLWMAGDAQTIVYSLENGHELYRQIVRDDGKMLKKRLLLRDVSSLQLVPIEGTDLVRVRLEHKEDRPRRAVWRLRSRLRAGLAPPFQSFTDGQGGRGPRAEGIGK